MRIMALALPALLAGQAWAGPDRESYPVRKTEEVRRTLKFAEPAKVGEVVVDNIFGPVTVEGYAGTDVLLEVTKTIYARSEDKVKAAAEEVNLDVAEKGNTIDLYVDGPFRCRDGRRGVHMHRDAGYEVHYAFTLQVPFKTNLDLSTVTAGDIEVRRVEGEFAVHNVNGKVRMIDVAGSGEAGTVNGELEVGFKSVPAGACDFKTLNGDLVLTLPENSGADFRLKTFHGEVYSDFDVTTLPARPALREQAKGRFVYKADRFFGVRAGRGGPEIALDTMNGDILIKKRTS